MEDSLLERLLAYIDGHIHQKVTLGDMAALAGYSPFYFSKLFVQRVGIPVTDYIRIRKLQHALAYLLEGKKVIETAMNFSFESHEGFTRAFKQMYRISPTEAKKAAVNYRVPPYFLPPRRTRRQPKTMQDTQDSLQNIYQMVYTFLSCSLEEAREGYATRVDVTLFSDGFIQAKDDGRGILLSPDEEKSEEIFRDILEGRPFTTQDCRRMGGLYPPDLQWVNSLSESLTVTVHREGRRYRQDYHRGVPLHRLTITPSDAPSGTSILLRPDRLLFKEATPSAEVIRSWLQEQATGLPLLTVRVKEETSSLS